MPNAGDQHDLGEVERHHLAARRAEALQGGDGRALAVDEAAHRIGDADAADQQRGQADEGQELREALDVAGKARIGVERASGCPSRPPAAAGSASAAICGPAPASVDSVRRQDEAVGPAHEAAGLDEAGGPQGLLRDEEPRPEADAVGDLVGLGDEARPQFDRRAARP